MDLIKSNTFINVVEMFYNNKTHELFIKSYDFVNGEQRMKYNIYKDVQPIDYSQLSKYSEEWGSCGPLLYNLVIRKLDSIDFKYTMFNLGNKSWNQFYILMENSKPRALKLLTANNIERGFFVLEKVRNYLPKEKINLMFIIRTISKLWPEEKSLKSKIIKEEKNTPNDSFNKVKESLEKELGLYNIERLKVVEEWLTNNDPSDDEDFDSTRLIDVIK